MIEIESTENPLKNITIAQNLPLLDYLFDVVAQYILYVNGLVSIIVNIFAVYVILKRSTRHMVGYKWILLHVTLVSAFVDLLISVLISPLPLANAVGTTMTGILGLLFPSQGRLFCILIVIATDYMIWSNLLCFAYRFYLVTTLCHKWMHKWIIVLLIISVLSSIVTVIIYLPALAYEDEVREYAEKQLNYYHLRHVALWLIVPRKYHANTVWGIYFIIHLFGHYIIFAIITGCINQILNKKIAMSKCSLAYHRMLLKSLICQSLVPVGTLVFPIFLLGVAQQLKQYPSTRPYARILSTPGMLLFSTYSISHVCVMLFFTTPYSRYIKGLLKGRLNQTEMTDPKLAVTDDKRSRCSTTGYKEIPVNL